MRFEGQMPLCAWTLFVTVCCAAGEARAQFTPFPLPSDGIVDIAFAPDDNVYAFTEAKTVSGGHPANLVWEKPPYPFLAPRPGSAIVGIAIDAGAKVHTWYRTVSGQITHSLGKTSNLDRFGAETPVTLGSGYDPNLIIGMAIGKKSGNVYTFFANGVVTYGTPTNLTSIGVESFTSPLPTSRIVGLAYNSKGVLYTWYDDGTYSIGTRNDLDATTGANRPYYARHGFLRSEYVSSNWTPQPPPGLPPAQNVDLGMNNTADLMVAAGHDYLAVARDASVQFYHRNGTPLHGGVINNGALDLTAAFAEFGRVGAPTLDVNNYMMYPGGPARCQDLTGIEDWDGNQIVDTLHDKLCVGADGLFDTRVEYDRVGGRFVIVFQLKNAIRTMAFSATPTAPRNPNFRCQEPTSIIMPGSGNDACTGDEEIGLLGRRLKAIAISKTSDPRDGFDTYVALHNDAKDWPMMSIDGDWLILANRDPSEADIHGATAMLVSLADLRQGRARPEYIRYLPSDFPLVNGNPLIWMEAPRQFEDSPGDSVLIGCNERADGPLQLVTLRHPRWRYDKQTPAVRDALITLGTGGNTIDIDQSVFYGSHLYVAQQIMQPSSRRSLRIHRIATFQWSGERVPYLNMTAPETVDHDLYFTSMLHVAEATGKLIAVANWKPEPSWGQSIVSRVFDPSNNTFLRERIEHGTPFYDAGVFVDLVGGKARAMAVDPNDSTRIFYAHRATRADGTTAIILDSFVP